MPGHPASSSSFTRKNAPFGSSLPKRRSWSKRPGFCPLRSMWKSFPASSACATPCEKSSPAIVSCATSGFRPTMSGIVERVDEREHVPDRRQEDVAARLVRLGLEREPQVVPLRRHVVAQEVQRVAKPAASLPADPSPRSVSDALASAPEHVRLGAELDAEVDRVHRLLERVRAHARVVAGERAVAEHRIAEEVRRRHRHLHAGVARAPP